MTEYFDEVDPSRPFTQNRKAIINGLRLYLEDVHGAETSQLNLNAWRLRFDLDIESQDEFDALVQDIREFLSSECPLPEVVLEWEYIPTDSNGQKNGFYSRGVTDAGVSEIFGGSYPVEAVRITVPK